MKTKIIEAVSDAGNHGKFMVCRLDEHEYDRKDISGYSLILPRWGAGRDAHLLIVDLETGEGAFFRPGGLPKADLNKKRMWVCVLFEPFLGWLYEQDPESWVNLDTLPDTVELTGIPLQLRGYRRGGVDVNELMDTMVDLHDRLSIMGADELRTVIAGIVLGWQAATAKEPPATA